MEYSPMMVLMLWALTPSDAASVEAQVQEIPTQGMTVHQESYFTFNHGRPFVAEKDPLTGAILNLKTTPVVQDDYVYDEDEETDGIDRKDGPKIFTRNDIAQPSKDPDLHKFLNLPVHYSTSGKFPLISSSYANTKIQGHGAGSLSNHRPNPTTSTSTVSPSYYTLKTTVTPTATTITSSPTSTATSTTRKPASSSSTASYISSSTTTTTTTTTTMKTTPKPFSAYEYEYEYDYDREPPQPEETSKKSTTQSILDFFDKDYEFLGASDEVKPDTNLEKVKSTTSEKPTEQGLMIASDTNIFIPAGYLKENKTEKLNNTTQIQEEKYKPTTVHIVQASSTIRPIMENIENQTEIVTPQSVHKKQETTTSKPPKEQNEYLESKVPEKIVTEKTTLKLEIISTTGKPKETVPFFPTISYDKFEEESKPSSQQTRPQQVLEESKPSFNIMQRPLQRPLDETTSSRPGYPHLYKPSDVQSNKPIDMMPPPYRAEEYYHQSSYLGHDNNPSQRPQTSAQVRPPQLQFKPQHIRPSESNYRPIGVGQSENNNKPLETGNTRPIISDVTLQKPIRQEIETPIVQHKPVESNVPQTKPIGLIISQKPVDLTPSSNRPYDGFIHSNRPIETATQSRPVEQIKPTQSRPGDIRYPPYLPDKQYIMEYRPLGSRPDIQEFNVGLGNRVPDLNKNRPEAPNYNKFQFQGTQPSKVENHFIKVSPGQENPSYSLQTSFSIGVPPSEEKQPGIKGSEMSGQGVGQVLFPDEDEKRPWTVQDEKRPLTDGEKYPRPPWETHLKPPFVFNHVKKDSTYFTKRPKPRPDLPNILPQFRPNAKIGHAEPHIYLKTPMDTLQPPPLPRPQFLRAEPPEEDVVHRRNGQSPRIPVITTPKRGSLRSEDEKTDPVFVVYPSNNAQEGVVVGTRGPQKPLPPDNLDLEDAFPLDSNKNFQARVDTPILKVKPNPKPLVKNEFPYPLVKPTDELKTTEEKSITSATKEYTAFSPTVPPTEKEHDAEINIIPYLQDYMPFATKKPPPESPVWNLGDDIKPISPTHKTKIEETTPKIKTDNHKTNENSPTPQDFQAPFHASLTAPSQGWSVVRPRPTDAEKTEETTTGKPEVETENTFDIQNFKPQLFGGFKPIIPPVEDKTEDKDKL